MRSTAARAADAYAGEQWRNFNDLVS